MTGQPVTMLSHLAAHLTRQGWRERDARATPHLALIFEWHTGTARVLIDHAGVAELVEIEGGEVAALTRWEQVTPGNVRRITTYIEGAQR